MGSVDSRRRVPALTVVVVVGPLRERAGGCLEALLSQDAVADLEVLLVDTAPDAPPVPGADHAAVRVLPVPGGTFAAVRALAVREARAPAVAFVEEHVRVRPGWAAALIAAHREPWAAVGGVVENANPRSGRSELNGLISYGLFYPPLPRGEVEVLPGNNSSFKRAVLLAYGERLPRLLANDNTLFAVLHRDGHRLLLEPAAVFGHLNEVSLSSAVRGYFLYHRCYGPGRSRELGWAPWRRAAYVLLAPVIPVYFAVRFSRLLARRRSPYLGLFLRGLPYVLAAQLAAACGQALGLVLGPGAAEAGFTAYELSEPRPEGPAGTP